MKIEKLLNFLRCPYCDNGKLTLTDNKNKLNCQKCSSLFDVINQIPILYNKKRLSKQEKTQQRLFNQHYQTFSDQDLKLENWRLSMPKRVFDPDYTKNIKTYLDIGCGATGYTVIHAAKKLGILAFGVDISQEAMLKAQNLAKKQGVDDKTAFIVCSAEKRLPFKKNLFNYVSAVSSLEHTDNDSQVVKNISKILKKAGRLYLTVPNSYQNIYPFLWPIYFLIDKKVGHKRHYSINDLNKILQKNNLYLNKAFYNGHLIKLLQLTLEKLKVISNQTWWRFEEKDINQNPTGLQLNAIYQKK